VERINEGDTVVYGNQEWKVIKTDGDRVRLRGRSYFTVWVKAKDVTKKGSK